MTEAATDVISPASGARRLPSARAFALLLAREFMIERRTLGWAGSMGLLALQAVVLLGLAFSGEAPGAAKADYTLGALWLVFLFAATIGVSRTFADEYRDGALSGVLALPWSPACLYAAKLASGCVFLSAALLAIGGASTIFLHLPTAAHSWAILLVVLSASLGFMAVALPLAALTTTLRGRDALLATALLPLLVPLFYAAASAARQAVSGSTGLDGIEREMLMMFGFDALYIGIGLLVFERAVIVSG